MLYYVYDYNADALFNGLMEQINETSYQVQSSLVNNNVKVAFAYYNLIQVANQLMFNPVNDPILSQFSQYPLFYIICENPADAQPVISATSGRALQPVIVALTSYIGNPHVGNCGTSPALCNNGLTCAEVCQLYNLVYTIQQGLYGGYNATILVLLHNTTQQLYLPLIAAYGLQLGLFSPNMLWILTELWLQPLQLVQLTGVGAPIYVISIPTIDASMLQNNVCNDFVVQMETSGANGDLLPCAISQYPGAVCDPSYGYLVYYKGYMPTSLQFTVRRLSFNSLQFFSQVMGHSGVSINYADLTGQIYNVPALPTYTEFQTLQQSQGTSLSVTSGKKKSPPIINWLPGNLNCPNNTTILQPFLTATQGAKLIKTSALSGLALYALGVLYEPLMMRVGNYLSIKQTLKKNALINNGFTNSMIVLYPTENGCDDYENNNAYQWCFFNATSYGILPDTTYANAASNATLYANNGSIIYCDYSLLVPFYDNTALYTGFSITLLSLLKTNLNFSVHVVESNTTIPNLAQELDSERKFGISAVHLVVNSANDRYVDFTSPSTTTGVNIIMNNQTYNPTWQILFPFGNFAWLLIVLSIFLITATFFVIDHLSRNEKKPYSFVTLFAYTYASFTQGAVDLTPKRLSARVLSMFMWFGVMLLLSSYTSAMSVVLLSPPSDGCVTGLFKLLTCGVMFNVAPNSIADLMLNDPYYSNLTTNRKFTGNFSQVMQYFNTDNNYTDYKHFAYVGDSAFNRYYYAQYCESLNISMIGQPEYIQFRSFAIPKGANYMTLLNAGLLNITTSGNKSAITQYWFPDPPAACTFSTYAKTLNYTDMAGLYYILMIGCGVAIACVIIENLKIRSVFKKQRELAPQLEVGDVYEATVIGVRLEGIEVEIKAQPQTFFVSYENLNQGRLQLFFANELGIKVGTVIFLKYFGTDKKTKHSRLVLVRVEESKQKSILVAESSA